MLKEAYYPQVKTIGNCICEVLTRKQQKYRDIAIGARAIFCRGSGEPFAQKFSQGTQMFTKQSKRNEVRMMDQHRPSYEVKIFMHLNLSYELIKHVKRNSCLYHLDGQRYLYELYRCWPQSWHIPFNVNKCDVTDTLLPHCAAEVSFQPAQPTKRSFCRTWYDSGKLC